MSCQNPFCSLQGTETQARAKGADALPHGSLPRKVVLELRLTQDPTAHQDDPEESQGAAEGGGCLDSLAMFLQAQGAPAPHLGKTVIEQCLKHL